jgi:hypothetical protein
VNMAKPSLSKPAQSPSFSIAVPVFYVLLFLAPGAFLVTKLPKVPLAQLSFVTVACIGVFLLISGLVPTQIPQKQTLLIVALLTVPALISWLANAYSFQEFFYDVYGEMPLVLWLAFPLTFLLSAATRLGKWTKPAVKLVVIVGALLLSISAFQRFWLPWINVFGSVAYSISAFIPLPFFMLWFARVETKQRLWWRIGAGISVLAIAYISYGLLGIFSVSAALCIAAAVCPGLLGATGTRVIWLKRLGIAATLILALAVCATLTPAVSKHLIPPAQVSSLSKNIRSRIELSYGAQRMLGARPLLGWGPAGYRFAAVRFLNAEIFDDTGSLGSEPTAYSPPSPHSLIWEVLTRLGIVGALALIVAAILWWKVKEKLTEGEPADIVLLRQAAAAAALAYLFSLLVTPMHFASGLFGAACAGIAIAPLATKPTSSAPAKSGESGVRSVPVSPAQQKSLAHFKSAWLIPTAKALTSLALLAFLYVFLTHQLGILASEKTVRSANEDLVRLERIKHDVPRHPLFERRTFDCRLLICDTVEENNTILTEALAAPGYVSAFGPNLINFARIGMNNLEQFNSTDLNVIATVLDKAETLTPETPALLGERLHYALIQGDQVAITQAANAFRPKAHLYEPGKTYLAKL